MSIILVTGGAGYIGTHTLVQLIEQGYTPVVYDNLWNASVKALEGVRAITGRRVDFVKGDIRDSDLLDKIFSFYNFSAVIHFAGLKAVGESVEKPLDYYENNVFGTMQLLEVMSKYNVKNMVFSSSATVYGVPAFLPLNESMPTGHPTNPYGRTKLIIENMLADVHAADNSWRIACLRYFNPVGAHPSGFIGEDPTGIPNNLMPFITQTASGKREKLFIFGDDYDTHDGTGVRDYIHVVDLANGHIKALQKIEKSEGMLTVNLGTGTGYSVLDLISAFEASTGVTVPHDFVARRPGDVASCYADPRLAKQILGWEAKLGIDDMCIDAWHWQSSNPDGYQNQNQ